MADLKKEEFEVFEDDVKQEVASLVLTHGGRVYNQVVPPPPPAPEGIILPPQRPTSDAAGRIFLIFVDDLHLDFRNTGRIRELFKKIDQTLVHDGDMFGMVSTGPSSIAIDLTYDRKRLQEAIKKIAGNGLKPQDILDAPSGAEGPSEVRYRAHVAFSTAYDIMKNLEQVHNRRKAFVYVSNGYDFNPFPNARAGTDMYGRASGQNSNFEGSPGDMATDPFLKQGNQFADADLARELAELTRAANRANATIYTIDPRGLVGGPDLDEKIDPVEYSELRPHVAGQPAGPGGGDRRHRRRQPERLRPGAEADRQRDQRLLRNRLLLDEPGPAEADSQGGHQDHPEGPHGLLTPVGPRSGRCRRLSHRSRARADDPNAKAAKAAEKASNLVPLRPSLPLRPLRFTLPDKLDPQLHVARPEERVARGRRNQEPGVLCQVHRDEILRRVERRALNVVPRRRVQSCSSRY